MSEPGSNLRFPSKHDCSVDSVGGEEEEGGVRNQFMAPPPS